MSSTGPSAGGQSGGPILDLGWRWKGDAESGWWQLQCEDGWVKVAGSLSKWLRPEDSSRSSHRQVLVEGDENWSGLQFRLTDRKQEELQLVYPPADQPAFRYADIHTGLQNVFQHVTVFRIIAPCSGLNKLISNIFEMVKSPATVLERLEVRPTLTFDSASNALLLNFDILVDAAMAGKLMGLKSLILDCSGVTVDKADPVALARAMESGQLSKLETLSLTNVKVDRDACEACGNAITSGNLQALKKMDFRSCEIDDSGAQALARGFESGKLKDLAELKLMENEIGNEGMIALAISLEVGGFSCLNSLDVQGNTWSDESIPFIAHAIESGNLRSLTEVYLVWPGRSFIASKENAEVLLSALLSRSSPKVTDVEFRWPRQNLRLQCEKLMLKNKEHRRIMAELGGGEVPATVGKVYICGDSQVGKTTLTQSLKRSLLKSLFRKERRRRRLERTRGIDVSVLSQPEGLISLMIWDMAGQNEYHLIHNSFFPDLVTEEGEAIAFLVMCKSTDIEVAREQLEYWLKFISSSVDKGAQIYREVCVVVNRIDGDPQVLRNISAWQEMVDNKRKKFDGVLKLSGPLFVADVRRRKAVAALKHHLIESTASKLKNVKVPDICQFVQTHLRGWSQEKMHFPVVSWDEFIRLVRGKGGDWQEKTVEAAVKYFNESGLIVYIRKEFPLEWGIPHQKPVILDPNWFCREIVGNMFVPSNIRRAGEDLFREKVNAHTGSIPLSVFNEWLEKVVDGWDNADFENLRIILLWLGLCYLGREENLFIPSLASEAASRSDPQGQFGDCWDLEYSRHDAGREGEQCQWVMGYSMHRAEEEKTLTPITLWHKFQVELAQTSTFNGHSGDNCFVTGRYFVSFRLDSMAILIKVHSHIDRPGAFEGIDVFVKPLFHRELDILDLNVRKQRQLDLASNLIEILVTLWIDICPRIEYIKRVVWPCPTFDFRPSLSYHVREENVEVEQVKSWVEEHGVGRVLNWAVGSSREPITEDQLLSTDDKAALVRSLKQSISQGRDLMREGMILYDDELDERSTQHEASALASQKSEMSFPKSATEVEQFFYMMFGKFDKKLDKFDRKLEIIIEKFETTNQQLSKLMREKRNLVRKVGDVGRLFLEDRESSCPSFIHLRTKTGSWMTFKKAMSPFLAIHVHFACEARYNSYGQHVVEGQAGIEVSELKPWAHKLLPWFRLSLTVLYVSAKLTGNVFMPLMGLILPDYPQWQEASSLAEGLRSATGYSKKELDEFMQGQEDFRATATLEGMRELYGSSRRVMTDLLGKLTVHEYEKKLGMRKVQLYYSDRSSHGVVWICNDCFKKFRAEGLVSELSQ